MSAHTSFFYNSIISAIFLDLIPYRDFFYYILNCNKKKDPSVPHVFDLAYHFSFFNVTIRCSSFLPVNRFVYDFFKFTDSKRKYTHKKTLPVLDKNMYLGQKKILFAAKTPFLQKNSFTNCIRPEIYSWRQLSVDWVELL